MNKKTVAVFAMLLAACLIALVASRTVLRPPPAEWKVKLGTPVVMVHNENGPFSARYIRDYNLLRNELLFADMWGEHEAAELVAFIEVPQISEPEITDTSDFDINALEMWLGRGDALAVIAQRLAAGAPIEPAQRPALIDALMQGLEQRESYRYFSASVTRLIDSGLVDEPGPYRNKIMEIYDSGAMLFGGMGESDAANIERQLKARGAW